MTLLHWIGLTYFPENRYVVQFCKLIKMGIFNINEEVFEKSSNYIVVKLLCPYCTVLHPLVTIKAIREQTNKNITILQLT